MNAQDADQEIKMRFPKWYLYNAAIASILYVLQYVFLILVFAQQKPDYNLLDSIYYQAEGIVFALVFYSFYRLFKPLDWYEHLVFRIAFAVSIMRLLNQTLDTFQIVYIGNIYFIIFEFIFILLSTVLCKWFTTLKR